MTTQLWAMGLVVFACLLGGFGPIFMKRASGEFSLNPLKMIKNYNLIIGIFFYAIGSVLFIPALKGGELSVLYPLVSTSYIFVSLYSIKMLKEKMSAPKWIGISFIVLGVTFIGFGA
jgi:undecaprenyl phosphate-alpha-L-ara4N flippase subunit ArnE